ncbi:hypothetical protein F1728_01485 [Gimesia benthica]|uniref:Uncharacterized protein n=1 Tax=Gimesia benthica TaxID=2608982 RepID=A0A6I6A7V4_9PLAN|nr:hypothetical protein [Gimesia benthica]QGQ21445.1 hypothetical protein F1728_01485 [Gimesia benthica]
MHKRIKLQSTIIKMVNQITPGNKNLTGLSRVAIHDWRVRNGRQDHDEVEETLLLLSEQIGALHDRSNPPKDDVIDSKTKLLIEKLKNQVKNKSSEISV